MTPAMKRRADREGNTLGAQRLCRPTILYQRSMALAQSVGSAAAMLFACKDSEGEQDYKAHRFRAAYPLHLGYWSFLCLFFLVGLIEPSFQLVSVCLAPLFLLLIVVRVLAHRLDDHHLAQRFGSLMIAAGDSVIWVLAMLIFRSTEIKAGFLIVGLYICTIVVYPIILAMRAHSSVQVWGVLSVAATTIIATPSWSALTQVEHVGLNMSAFALGIAIAYMIERLQRLLVQHERPQLAREREEAKGERPDSRERSQHDSPHAQEAVLRMRAPLVKTRRHPPTLRPYTERNAICGPPATRLHVFLSRRSSSLVLSSHLDYASYERVQELARGAHGTAVLWRCRNTGNAVCAKQRPTVLAAQWTVPKPEYASGAFERASVAVRGAVACGHTKGLVCPPQATSSCRRRSPPMQSRSRVCSRCRMRCAASLSQCNPTPPPLPPHLVCHAGCTPRRAFQHAAPPHRTVCTGAQARLLQNPNPTPIPTPYT